MDERQNRVVRFGQCTLDLEMRFLWCGPAPVQMPPKQLELLCMLVERKGLLVTKEEIWRALWEDTFVEESNLSHNIYLLRRALKDLGEKDLIQTVPRRGYRFSGEVKAIDKDVVFEKTTLSKTVIEIEEEISEVEPRTERTPESARIRFSRGRIALAAALLLLICGIILIQTSDKGQSGPAYTEIAVLPLRNLNPEGSPDMLSFGLTDSLISRLGSLRELSVRPFSAVEDFAEGGKDSVTFARDLKVDALIEGTIQTSGSRLRVNLRLVETATGGQVWAHSFDEPGDDLFGLQDRISGRVAALLIPKIRPAEKSLLSGRPTSDPVAYQFYLAGRERWMRRDGKADSLVFYRKAIDRDPNFALAYLGIADQIAFSQDTREAEAALEKAMALDPNLTEVHATKGFLQMFHHWDWSGAGKSFRKAIELSPNSSKAHHWFGVFLSLQGRLDEALTELERARELDPTSLAIRSDIGEIYYFKRDFERAERELESVLETDPDFSTARNHLVKVRYKKGSSFFREEAKASIESARRTNTEGIVGTADLSELEKVLNSGDEKALVNKFLARSLETSKGEKIVYFSLATYFTVLGRKDEALDALEQVSQIKPFMLPFIAVDPIWDNVRNEERFQRIVQQMGLSPA